jgi:hypothetical protein
MASPEMSPGMFPNSHETLWPLATFLHQEHDAPKPLVCGKIEQLCCSFTVSVQAF